MRLVILCAASLLISLKLHARLWSVPFEVNSIQSAFDSCAENDTVLVASGVYSEALVAPSVQVVLIGATSPFSQTPVVIDPTLLPGSDSLVCLKVSTASMQIDSILFRNGAQMFPRRPGTLTGGVIVSASNVVFHHCFFDSVHAPIRSSQLITVMSSEFNSARSGCVTSSGGLRAELCAFSGIGFALIAVDQTLLLSSCSVSGESIQYLVSSNGHVDIQNCVFGPLANGESTRLFLANASGSIANNIFEDITDDHQGIVALESACDGSIEFTGNTFRNVVCRDYLVSLNDVCNPQTPTEFTRNSFENCVVNSAFAKAISVVEGNAVIENNSFRNLTGSVVGAVHVESDSTVLRRNIFLETEYAVQAGVQVDARQNYWGDSTGPYHPTLNPGGLGDRVSDSVIFEPWYPDTSFLIDAVEERIELPTEFTFSVYPNPFNGEARLSLFVPEPFIASIELTNVLGQLVLEIHRGPVYGQEYFSIGADQLPSGVYFVRVRDVVRNSVAASQKIALIR